MTAGVDFSPETQVGWEGETCISQLDHPENSFTLVDYSRRLVYGVECAIGCRVDCVFAENISPPLPRDTIDTRNARGIGRIRANKP